MVASVDDRRFQQQQREAEEALYILNTLALEEAEKLQDQPLIRPQPGPQEKFLRCPADICIYGGAAGGGKSYAGLLEPLYHIDNPDFECVIFRRTFKQITAPGGLWDRSMEMYPQCGAKPNFSSMSWTFPSGAKVRFSHMQHEQDVLSWKGSEIVLIIFDELTDFTEYMFWYMLSRNRSLSGIKPYMRAMTNPDADSWVKALIAPWVDPDYSETASKNGWDPTPAKDGEIRWFVRENGVLRWCDRQTPFAKSITFIAANIFDNKVLMERDPNYLANLEALPDLEKQRLLHGNWTIRPSGKKFKREWFLPVLDVAPPDIVAKVRFWDLAATEEEEDDMPKHGLEALKNGPDYTAGVLMGKTKRNTFVILDVVWARLSPLKTMQLVQAVAEQDGPEVPVWIEEEGGSGGKYTTTAYRHGPLMAFDFHRLRQSASKLARGNIFASHAEMRNIQLLKGAWNDGFLNFLMGFPNPRIHDDPPDAAFSALIVLLQVSADIPIVVSGRTPRSQLPLKAVLGEEAPQEYQPQENEMNEDQLKALAARQALVSRILRQVADMPGGHYTEDEHSASGGWI